MFFIPGFENEDVQLCFQTEDKTVGVLSYYNKNGYEGNPFRTVKHYAQHI